MRKYLALIAALFVVSGCAGVNYHELNSLIADGDCQAAQRYLNENRDDYGSNRRLLYLLDNAQVNMLCGDYVKSNRFFQQADILAEDLWTKSITRTAASFVINDYTVPYGGEDFERALINLFSAINYAVIGDLDEALVECRSLDEKLTAYNDKYGSKNVYKEDAFGRYLSGIIYEADGSMDDAYIDYYKAYQTYKDYESAYGTPMPQALVEDLGRAAREVGRTDELMAEDGFEVAGGLSYPQTRELGKVVFIHLNGRAPVKVENWLLIPTSSMNMKLAFPSFIVRPPACRQSSLKLVSAGAGNRVIQSELVEDINKIAVKNLSDRGARVVVKAIARAYVKRALVHEATKNIKDKNARAFARLTGEVLAFVTEWADTRSWRTLPGEIYLARAYLPPGRYELEAGTCGAWRRPLEPIDLKAGETKFVLLHSMF